MDYRLARENKVVNENCLMCERTLSAVGFPVSVVANGVLCCSCQSQKQFSNSCGIIKRAGGMSLCQDDYSLCDIPGESEKEMFRFVKQTAPMAWRNLPLQ